MTQNTQQTANLPAKPLILLFSLDSVHFSFAVLVHRTLVRLTGVPQRENGHYLKVRALLSPMVLCILSTASYLLYPVTTLGVAS